MAAVNVRSISNCTPASPIQFTQVPSFMYENALGVLVRRLESGESMRRYKITTEFAVALMTPRILHVTSVCGAAQKERNIINARLAIKLTIYPHMAANVWPYNQRSDLMIKTIRRFMHILGWTIERRENKTWICARARTHIIEKAKRSTTAMNK